MSTKQINLCHGDRVTISDDRGIALRVDNSEGGSTVNLDIEQARALARALNAFAEIHDSTI